MIAPVKKQESLESELHRLHREQERLLRQLSEHAGEDLFPATLDREAPGHWDEKAGRILATYNRVSDAAASLASQRCSRQVSRLIRELNSDEPLSVEVQQWWWSRY